MIFFALFTLIFAQNPSSVATCTDFCGAGTGVLPASVLSMHVGEVCIDAVELTKDECLQQQKNWIPYNCGEAERWFLTQTDNCEDFQKFYRTTPCCSNEETSLEPEETSANPDETFPPACCKALTADCLSCAQGISKEEYCRLRPWTTGCPRQPGCMQIPTGQFDVWGPSDGKFSAMSKVATQNVVMIPSTPCEGTANVLTNDGNSIAMTFKVTWTQIEAEYVEPDTNSIEQMTGSVDGDKILWSKGYVSLPVGQIPPEAKFDLMYALDKALKILESIIKDEQVTRSEVVDFLVGQNTDLYLGFDEQFIRDKANAVFNILESQTDSDSDIIAESDIKELHEQIVSPGSTRRYEIVDDLLNALRLTNVDIRMIFGVLDRNGNLEISAADFIHYVQTHFHLTELPSDLEMHINKYVELWFNQYSFDFNMVSSMINAGFDCAHGTITSMIDALAAGQELSEDVFFDFIQCIHDKTGLSKKLCEHSVYMDRLTTLDPDVQNSCYAAMDDNEDPVSDCACFNYLLDVGDIDMECFWEADNRGTLREHAENLCRPENPPVGPQPGDNFIEVFNYPCRTHGQDPHTINTKYYPAGMNDNRVVYRSDNQQWWIYYDTNCGGNNDHPSAWYLTPQRPGQGVRPDGGCTNTMRIEMPYDSSFPSTRESAWFMCDDGMWKDWTKENPPMAPVTVAFSTQQSQPCMAIPTGQFDVFDPAGAIVGSQEVHMTGPCTGTANVNTMDGKYLSFNFAISNGELQVEYWNDDTQTNERFTGKVMGDGFDWSTGYSSKRSGSGNVPGPNPPVSCHQDEERLFRFVMERETTMHDVKILKGGCEVLECPEKRARWCMEPEVSESCPCQCQEIPVCDTGRIRGWLSRADLPKSCIDFFVSGMAHQHRDVCECMRAFPNHVALEMFKPECKFSPGASDTFFSTWRNCNY
jgi:hypothetical protein